jgi:hypothetical protein
MPQRGLYTSILLLDAIGIGNASACIYPYVDQLLQRRVADPDRKLGGLVLQVKGDFCRQVRRYDQLTKLARRFCVALPLIEIVRDPTPTRSRPSRHRFSGSPRPPQGSPLRFDPARRVSRP